MSATSRRAVVKDKDRAIRSNPGSNQVQASNRAMDNNLPNPVNRKRQPISSICLKRRAINPCRSPLCSPRKRAGGVVNVSGVRQSLTEAIRRSNFHRLTVCVYTPSSFRLPSR